MRQVIKGISIIMLVICGFLYFIKNNNLDSIENKKVKSYKNKDRILVNEDYGIGNYKPEQLTIPDIEFTKDSDREEKQVAYEIAQPLENMVNDAKEEGIELIGNSAYRSYKSQKEVYNNRIRAVGRKKDEVELIYYIDIVYEKAKRLNLLINDLFELTKMKNSNIDIKKSKINLGELIGQVTAYLNYQFDKADMEPRLYFYDENIIVNADSEKLVRVFENLLTNAIKYGKDGHYVDITSKIEGNMAVIKVINYGKSISDIDLPYIFDRFYRVEKSRNSKVAGSGLGLAITKSIIELHNGKISAYSSEEKTVFEIKLPIDK